MTPLDIAGHFGYLFLIIGHLLVAEKNSMGFVLRIMGGLIWVILGGFLGLSSIILWSGLFAFVDCWGFYKWKVLKKFDEDIGGKR